LLRKLLVLLSVILLIINLLLISKYGDFERRLVRITTTTAFFILFLLFGGYKKTKFIILFLLLICVDFLAIFYEANTLISKIITIPKVLAYLVILSDVLKKLKIKNAKKSISLFFIIIIALNISLLYKILIVSSNNIAAYINRLLFFGIGVIIIALCTSALIYNFRYNSKRSLLFVFITFAFALSDASWFIAYFINAEQAFYFDIAFYLISLNSIIIYTLETSNNEDVFIEQN